MTILWILTAVGFALWIYKLQARITKLESSAVTNLFKNSIASPETKKAKPETKQNNTDIDEVLDDGIDRSKWPSHLHNTIQQNSLPVYSNKKEKNLPFDFENFLGQKLFPILGATSIVIALGFFAVWAFSNGWVGPMGRIAFGVMVSLALMGLGEYLKTKYPDFFTYLVSAGLAGLIITTLIAHYAYDFISAGQALILLILQTGVGVLLTLRYNSRTLGNLSIAAGLLAPWFTGQLDPMMVLPFILVLTFAGFILALNKKWPETFFGLILFSSSYIFAAIDDIDMSSLNHQLGTNLTTFEGATVNPLLLLAFAALIYGLIASAGIARLILSYKTDEPPSEESSEMVIFTLSLLLFNFCAAVVFSVQEWSHIGFLVGAQALGLLVLAEWFKTKEWPKFHQLTLITALLFVLLATLLELSDLDPIILTLVLIIEATLMCAIGQNSKQKIYEWFGRATLLFALIHSLSNTNPEFILEGVLTLTFITALVYSIGSRQSVVEKIWLGSSLFISTSLLFNFSFDTAEIPDFLASILPSIWTLGLLYIAYLHQSFFMRMATLLSFATLSLLIIDQKYSNELFYLSTWLPIAITGGLLYIVSDSYKSKSKIDKVISYTAIIILTFSWLVVTAKALSEPTMTLSWLALIAVLMTLGLKYNKFTELRYVGLALMLLVIAKLYLIDIWQWDIPVRVIAFAALGLALLGIGFFYQKTWLKK